MRLTKEQAERNREHILEVASRLFREHGFDGVGVAELMKASGFTHGGFYNHFPSKEALAAEACASSLERANREFAESLRQGGGPAWTRFLEDYLSSTHRDERAGGCTVASLAADASRQGTEVQASLAEGLETALGISTEFLAGKASGPGEDVESARQKAVGVWCKLVGAVVLARAVAEARPALSEEILEAVRHELLG
jgi:TetR/AcrR family transcriptional regulator, transcriptional repressor for nem operon